ncbi:MAG: hypothetical protein IAG13_28200, partial [Deltaproteobacteria bacterium]|nr:hypothetical protein [Nannocystaceae bacterium]
MVAATEASLERLMEAATRLAAEAPAAIERAVAVVREHSTDEALIRGIAIATILVELRLDDVALQAAVVRPA